MSVKFSSCVSVSLQNVASWFESFSLLEWVRTFRTDYPCQHCQAHENQRGFFSTRWFMKLCWGIGLPRLFSKCSMALTLNVSFPQYGRMMTGWRNFLGRLWRKLRQRQQLEKRPTQQHKRWDGFLFSSVLISQLWLVESESTVIAVHFLMPSLLEVTLGNKLNPKVFPVAGEHLVWQLWSQLCVCMNKSMRSPVKHFVESLCLQRFFISVDYLLFWGLNAENVEMLSRKWFVFYRLNHQLKRVE